MSAVRFNVGLCGLCAESCRAMGRSATGLSDLPYLALSAWWLQPCWVNPQNKVGACSSLNW